jgi:hypothetical protein
MRKHQLQYSPSAIYYANTEDCDAGFFAHHCAEGEENCQRKIKADEKYREAAR